MTSHIRPHDPQLLPAQLIDLMAFTRDHTANITFDIKYASTDNFTGQVIYPQARAFIMHEAAQALLAVTADLHPHGLGLRVFDAYRPWHITAYFWEHFPNDHLYLADPREGSRHNRGCAIDLSLYDLTTGAEVEMPSAYDEFNEKSHLNYAGGTDVQNTMRALLHSTMLSHGFSAHPHEWWHFDYTNWQIYAVRDDEFEHLDRINAQATQAIMNRED